jgi:osmotically-inducible protein OsmY
MNAVAVEVRDGQVLLSGRLPDEEALRVVSETSQIQGVKGVKDEIRRYSQEQQPAAGAEQAA